MGLSPPGPQQEPCPACALARFGCLLSPSPLQRVPTPRTRCFETERAKEPAGSCGCRPDCSQLLTCPGSPARPVLPLLKGCHLPACCCRRCSGLRPRSTAQLPARCTGSCRKTPQQGRSLSQRDGRSRRDCRASLTSPTAAPRCPVKIVANSPRESCRWRHLLAHSSGVPGQRAAEQLMSHSSPHRC